MCWIRIIEQKWKKMVILGLEPRTTALLALRSTDWAIRPFHDCNPLLQYPSIVYLHFNIVRSTGDCSKPLRTSSLKYFISRVWTTVPKMNDRMQLWRSFSADLTGIVLLSSSQYEANHGHKHAIESQQTVVWAKLLFWSPTNQSSLRFGPHQLNLTQIEPVLSPDHSSSFREITYWTLVKAWTFTILDWFRVSCCTVPWNVEACETGPWYTRSIDGTSLDQIDCCPMGDTALYLIRLNKQNSAQESNLTAWVLSMHVR